MEAREAGDEVLLGRRSGRRAEQRRHDEDEEGDEAAGVSYCFRARVTVDATALTSAGSTVSHSTLNEPM